MSITPAVPETSNSELPSSIPMTLTSTASSHVSPAGKVDTSKPNFWQSNVVLKSKQPLYMPELLLYLEQSTPYYWIHYWDQHETLPFSEKDLFAMVSDWIWEFGPKTIITKEDFDYSFRASEATWKLLQTKFHQLKPI